MQIFSTDDAPLKDRFAYWREVLTQHFVHLRPERIDDGGFSSAIRAQTLCGYSFSSVCAGPQRVHRGVREIARSPFDLVFFNLQTEGGGSFRQNGEETALSPGDIFIIDATRPFELGCPTPLTQLSLKIPRSLLWQRLRFRDDAPGARIDGKSYVGKLLGGYLSALWRGEKDGAAKGGDDVVSHLADLVAFDIDRRRMRKTTPRPAVRAAIYQRAKRFIAANACDPDLAPRAVAEAMGASLRTLQSIFAEREDSIARRIQQEKLKTADRLLGDSDWRGRKISDIAFMAGFNDLSHFTHSFVRTFGETPGARRRRRLD